MWEQAQCCLGCNVFVDKSDIVAQCFIIFYAPWTLHFSLLTFKTIKKYSSFSWLSHKYFWWERNKSSIFGRKFILLNYKTFSYLLNYCAQTGYVELSYSSSPAATSSLFLVSHYVAYSCRIYFIPLPPILSCKLKWGKTFPFCYLYFQSKISGAGPWTFTVAAPVIEKCYFPPVPGLFLPSALSFCLPFLTRGEEARTNLVTVTKRKM